MTQRQEYVNIILDRNDDQDNLQERRFLEALPMSDLEALVRNTDDEIINSDNEL
jgi:hypothetical protein